MNKKSTSKVDPLLAAVCKALAARREVLGISQEEVAHRAGLHRTYISDIERGARNPTLKTLTRLSVALEIAASALLRQAEERVKQGEHENGSPLAASSPTRDPAFN